jgi:hypothetical protein
VSRPIPGATVAERRRDQTRRLVDLVLIAGQIGQQAAIKSRSATQENQRSGRSACAGIRAGRTVGERRTAGSTHRPSTDRSALYPGKPRSGPGKARFDRRWTGERGPPERRSRSGRTGRSRDPRQQARQSESESAGETETETRDPRPRARPRPRPRPETAGETGTETRDPRPRARPRPRPRPETAGETETEAGTRDRGRDGDGDRDPMPRPRPETEAGTRVRGRGRSRSRISRRRRRRGSLPSRPRRPP